MVERLKPIALERKNTRNVEFHPTHIEGVFIKSDIGMEPKIPKKTVETFQRLGSLYAPTEHAQKDLKKQMDNARDQLLGIAQQHEGFRGMVSEADAWDITITTSSKKLPIRDILKKDLGNVYASYVTEDYQASITIPYGTLSADGKPIDAETVRKAIRATLGEIGIGKIQIPKILSDEIRVQVNSRALAKAQKEGKIRLSEGAFEEEGPIYRLKSEIIT